MYLVEFAGVELTTFCFVEKIKRTLLPPRSNFSKEITGMNGSYFVGYKYGERQIEVDIAFLYDSPQEYVERIRKMADILNVKSPCKLILGDEPDKYYYAVPEGDFEVDKISKKSAKATITFICHDPIAYSVRWDSYYPDESNIFTIDNEGTMETYPYLSIRFNAAACFFQCTNYKGETVLIGKPKDSTQPTAPNDSQVLNDPCNDSTNFTGLPPSLLTDSRVAEGHLGVGFNGEGIVCTNFGNSVEGKWCGGALKRALSQDASEFEIEVDVTFSSQGDNYQPPSYKPPSSGSGGNGSYGNYVVTTKAGLIVRSTGSTSGTKKATMPYNTKVEVYEIKNGWARHSYKGLNGWSSMDYLKKVSSKKSASYSATRQYAEKEMGIIEVYGYDRNGAILFVNQLYDGNEYYEFVEPKIFIGSKKVLDQGRNAPAPRTVTETDDNGKQTSYFDVSGVFGDFNDCTGKFVIRRTRNHAGDYLWEGSFTKYVDGVAKFRIETPNAYSNGAYPKGDLNSLGIYIGKYGDKPAVDVMAVTHLRVLRLNPYPQVPTNLEIFRANDKLEIDFLKGTVYKNGKSFLTNLDIGSEFFTIPTGTSQMIVRSDDASVDVVCGIQERFL